MTDASSRVERTMRPLNSPRMAAFAGILFAILFTISTILIHLSLPEDLVINLDWIVNQVRFLRIALTLFPFAGIAYLWFIGVIRDHIGTAEDRLFSTVFLGSSLLFLAMVFTSGALAGGLIASVTVIKDQEVLQGVAVYSRAVMLQITNVYTLRMAAVTMTSLASIWLRTGKMPRWLGIASLILAAILLLVTNYGLWITLIFPIWVFVISVFILVRRLREPVWGDA